MTSLKQRWPLLFIFCVLGCNSVGLAFGMGAIFTDIMDTYEVSRATASLVQSLCIGLMYTFGIVTGPFVRLHGPRVTVIMGSVLATAGCVIAFLASHIVQVIVGIGVMSGIGMSLNYLSAQIMAGILFYDMKSLALTAFSISLSTGSAVYSRIYYHVTNHYSVRGTFLILAAINCQMILCGVLIGLFVPRSPGKTAVNSERRKKAGGADDAGFIVDLAENEENHGIPRKPGDGGGDCGRSVNGSRNGDSMRFVAEDRDTATNDRSLNCTLTESQEENSCTDFDHDGPEMLALGKRLDCHPLGSLSDSNTRHAQEKVLPEMQGSEPDPEICQISAKDVTGRRGSVDPLKIVSRVEKSGKSRRNPVSRIKQRNFHYFSRRSLNRVFQLDIFRDVRFAVFGVFGTSCFIFIPQPAMFMTDMAKSNGLSSEDGSFFITIYYVGSLVGRCTSGVLYRLLQHRVVFATALCIGTSGLACLSYAFIAEYPHFVAVSFTYGICSGFVTSLPSMTFLEILGPQRYASGFGFVAAVIGVYLFLAGPFGGLIRDLTHSYEPTFYIAAVHGLVVGSVLFFTALHYRHRAV